MAKPGSMHCRRCFWCCAEPAGRAYGHGYLAFAETPCEPALTAIVVPDGVTFDLGSAGWISGDAGGLSCCPSHPGRCR